MISVRSACPMWMCSWGIEPYHLWKNEEDHSQGRLQGRRVPLPALLRAAGYDFPGICGALSQYQMYCPPRTLCPQRGSENSLKAFMWFEGHTFESRLFTFNILDRVGGGDAFASGLIYAMMHDYKPMDMINFAVAAAAPSSTHHPRRRQHHGRCPEHSAI